MDFGRKQMMQYKYKLVFFCISGIFLGTRHRGGHGELLDFKKGAFHVALDAKMAILPIVISEYDNILGPPKEEKFQGGEVIS